ncbi:MAG: GNAT family N-acetyltransferase [Alphaproteobacteria bacterium]|nr:GNAT family N-acetyltransferase [Alphaproteobacteria bacterium]
MIALFRQSVRVVARSDYTAAQTLAWAPDDIDADAWAARLSTRWCWVAEIGGALAGFAELEPDGHLDMMYVHPAHQGRGVATALLGHAEAIGLARLYTEASITARPFFERRGFRLVAAQTVVRRGQELVNFRMEKSGSPRRPASFPPPDPGG